MALFDFGCNSSGPAQGRGQLIVHIRDFLHAALFAYITFARTSPTILESLRGNPCGRLDVSGDLSIHVAAAVSSLIKVYGVKFQNEAFRVSKQINQSDSESREATHITAGEFSGLIPSTRDPHVRPTATATAKMKSATCMKS